jgi:integrase
VPGEGEGTAGACGGTAWGETAETICVSHHNTPLRPSVLSQAFRRHLKANGLPLIRFHDLRHSTRRFWPNSGPTPRSCRSAWGTRRFKSL